MGQHGRWVVLLCVACTAGDSAPSMPSAAAAALSQDECAAGKKRCGGICASPHPRIGCGMDGCTACPGVHKADAKCNANECPLTSPGRPEETMPAHQGCPDPIDPVAAGTSPLSGIDCPDPFADPPTKKENCCFTRCFQGHHYWFCWPIEDNVHTGWDRASDYCQGAGMKLAQVDNYVENNFIGMAGAVAGMGPIWIGLNSMGNDNEIRWSQVTDDNGVMVAKDGKFVDGAFAPLTWVYDDIVRSVSAPCMGGCGVYTFGVDNHWSGQPAAMSSGYPFVCEKE